MSHVNESFELLTNGSLFLASAGAYEATIGLFFWPIIFLFTLFLLFIKSENPAYIAIYAILGNFALATLLPIQTDPIFYTTAVLSLALVLWSFFGSGKIEP